MTNREMAVVTIVADTVRIERNQKRRKTENGKRAPGAEIIIPVKMTVMTAGVMTAVVMIAQRIDTEKNVVKRSIAVVTTVVVAAMIPQSRRIHLMKGIESTIRRIKGKRTQRRKRKRIDHLTKRRIMTTMALQCSGNMD